MKDPRPETPPLTRAGRVIADKTLAAATFTPTSDGQRLTRQYEVHGIAVTESVSAAANTAPAGSRPPTTAPAVNPTIESADLKEGRPETPPLTRYGRKIADATLASTKFATTADGKSAIRQFDVYGVVVHGRVNLEKDGNAVDDHKWIPILP